MPRGGLNPDGTRRGGQKTRLVEQKDTGTARGHGDVDALNPLDYLLLVMRSPDSSPQERLQAARDAARTSIVGSAALIFTPTSADSTGSLPDEWAADMSPTQC